MNKFLLTTSAIVALAFMPVNTGLAQDTASIVIGTDVDAGTLDPRLTRDTTAYRTADLIYSGLVHITPNLVAVPDLAESWEAPDPTTYVFKLRPDLKFSDGSPLTADDVVFTYTTLIDPATNAPNRTLYVPISKVEAVDPQTVKFTLTDPYAPLLSYLDVGIISKKAVEAGKDPATDPIGAGPMKLAAWNRGSDIELEVNPNFWGEAPKVQKVTLKIIGDNTGFLKLIFARKDLKLIGVHVMGENASEMVHIGVIAMQTGSTVELFNRVCFNFPTLGDMYKSAAYDALLTLKGEADAAAATIPERL